jgi:hypothetical protein
MMERRAGSTITGSASRCGGVPAELRRAAADTSQGKKPEAFAPESTYNLKRVAIQDGYHDKDIL